MSDARGQAPYLSDVSVVELGSGLAAAHCGRWLRLHGANVIKVEPPEGDRLRHEDLTPDGWRHSEAMTLFAAMHAGKRSHVLDIDSPEGRAALDPLLDGAQVIVSSFTRTELARLGLTDRLTQPHGEQLLISCTPYGLDGPYADYVATDEVLLAIGGSMNTFGNSKEAPRHVRVSMADYVGGVYGFISALLGLLNPQAGTVFDVSTMDCLATNLERVTSFYSHLGMIHLRGHGVRRHFAGHPGGLYPCSDGYVMVALGHVSINMLSILVDDPSLEEHELFKDRMERQRRTDEFDELILPWFLSHSAEEIVTKAHELTMPFGYVPRPLDLVDDTQLAFRQSLVEVAFPGSQEHVRMPGLPYRYWELDAAGAPDDPLVVPALGSDGGPA